MEWSWVIGTIGLFWVAQLVVLAVAWSPILRRAISDGLLVVLVLSIVIWFDFRVTWTFAVNFALVWILGTLLVGMFTKWASIMIASRRNDNA